MQKNDNGPSRHVTMQGPATKRVTVGSRLERESRVNTRTSSGQSSTDDHIVLITRRSASV